MDEVTLKNYFRMVLGAGNDQHLTLAAKQAACAAALLVQGPVSPEKLVRSLNLARAAFPAAAAELRSFFQFLGALSRAIFQGFPTFVLVFGEHVAKASFSRLNSALALVLAECQRLIDAGQSSTGARAGR